MTMRIAVVTSLFVLILASGAWLTYKGQPYPALIFNLHKLSALLFTVLAGIIIYPLQKAVGATPLIMILETLALLLVLALFISGALLSLGKPANPGVLLVHKIAPLLSAVCVGLTLYLLLANKK